MAVLIAVLVTFGVLNRNSEIIAMKATGISLYRSWSPWFRSPPSSRSAFSSSTSFTSRKPQAAGCIAQYDQRKASANRQPSGAELDLRPGSTRRTIAHFLTIASSIPTAASLPTSPSLSSTLPRLRSLNASLPPKQPGTRAPERGAFKMGGKTTLKATTPADSMRSPRPHFRRFMKNPATSTRRACKPSR